MRAARVHHAARRRGGGVAGCGAGAAAGRAKRVAVLMNSAATDATYQSYFAAFKDALHQLGWIEGQNIGIECAGARAMRRLLALMRRS